MTQLRLVILTALMLAVAGCGGGSGTLRPETAAMPDEADVAPTELARATVLQDTTTEEDALAEERQQAEQAITGMAAESRARAGCCRHSRPGSATQAGWAVTCLMCRSAGMRSSTAATSGCTSPIIITGYPVVLSSGGMKWIARPPRRALRGIRSAPGRCSTTAHSPSSPCAGTIATTATTWRQAGGCATDPAAAAWKPVRSSTGRSCAGPLPDNVTLPLSGQGRLLRRSCRVLPNAERRPLHGLSLRHSDRER